MNTSREPRGAPTAVGEEAVRRWECPCKEPAVLLGTIERGGRINIKVRDRYWHVEGVVRTTCPRCGMEHLLDLRPDRRVDATASAPTTGPA
jgi:hypothetical protein